MEPVIDVHAAHGAPTAQETDARIRRETRTRRPLVWLVAALVIAVIALLAVTVLRPAGPENPLVLLNHPAPDFTLSLYGGGTLHLNSLRGKTVVVNFWWSDCAPCVQEAPILERQWRAWKNRGVVFVGIDELDTSPPLSFLRTYGVTYPNGADPGDVDIQYGTTGQPETFFITPRGIVKDKYAQPFPDDATLAGLIQEART